MYTEAILWTYTMICGVQQPNKDSMLQILDPVCKVIYCENNTRMQEEFENLQRQAQQKGYYLYLDPVHCDRI